ncbi:hypothetical protein IQ279_09290 [Streptomyces verrucosisporus]|nr:hypothetical protein [Streptomyces verrucosisporus]
MRYWEIDFQDLSPVAAGAFGVFALLLMALLFWGLLKTRPARPRRDPEARERARARGESRRRQAELRKRRLALQKRKAGRR